MLRMYNIYCECRSKFKLKRALLCEECRSLVLQSVRLSRAAFEFAALPGQWKINVGSPCWSHMENGITLAFVLFYVLPRRYTLQYNIMLSHKRLKIKMQSQMGKKVVEIWCRITCCFTHYRYYLAGIQSVCCLTHQLLCSLATRRPADWLTGKY